MRERNIGGCKNYLTFVGRSIHKENMDIYYLNNTLLIEQCQIKNQEALNIQGLVLCPVNRKQDIMLPRLKVIQEVSNCETEL